MSPRKPAGPTPVEAIVHPDKRANLPTADARDLVPPDVERIVPVAYPRDLHSPMLVWQGKETLDDADLEIDAPPIYIQEKIDPRVLIEHLRDTAAPGEAEPELTLFESFDGLTGLDLVEFYKHEANWSNRMILGDSLQVMASLAERERLRGKVQMIYIDPPYGIKFGSNWQVSARKRDVKDGKVDDVAREAEQIRAFRDTWEFGINSYLPYLRDRLEVARDLLTESGSVFVQIGDENVHLVRSLLDEVFGSSNFVTTITLSKTTSATNPYLGGTVDFIHWYARDLGTLKFRPLYIKKVAGGAGGGMYRYIELADRTRRPATRGEMQGDGPAGARLYRRSDLTSQAAGRAKGEGAASWFPVSIGGREYRPSMQARWKTNEAGMSRLLAAGRIEPGGNSLNYVRYMDDFPAFPISEVWLDLGGASDKVYVVQTSTKVVERCMLMATDPGDLVLDPTCGSGTTAFVAESWGRRWITIDTSRVALALARQRLMGSRYPFYLLADSADGRDKESKISRKALPPSNPRNDVRQGFVYERVQHVTLKSIASNPDIKDGMTPEEVETAITRHAEFELLYDRPFENRSIVRVSGPFTVESLSPHRSLAGIDSIEPTSVKDAASDPDRPTFEQTILDNLRIAGIQNGKRAERLAFDVVEPYATPHIQAVGVREGATDGGPTRVGISIGPQYGTVSPPFVKGAARDATKANDLDLLCVLGFAFDPQVLNADEEYLASDESFDVAAERALGRIPVLLVRMNTDLLMGEELKKTGAGNLFTVFGEPDLNVDWDGDSATVELRGVDIYDPTTGEIRSSGTEQVALWMIDTDYDGESFFVRHCYFTGGQDPCARLKKALRADIDDEAWSSLYRTVSRSFPRPDTGKIAVKVINDYGDEVVKVFEV